MAELIEHDEGFCERYCARSEDYYFSAGVMHMRCVKTDEGYVPDPGTPYLIHILAKRKGSQQPPEQRTATEWFPTKEEAIQ